ncbi:hypothetical protein CMI37_03675 [Candidatus Pacearchaeota archaeon]|nr:hypothetical protein [Candidatus Pacearchaeota archaeon]
MCFAATPKMPAPPQTPAGAPPLPEPSAKQVRRSDAMLQSLAGMIGGRSSMRRQFMIARQNINTGINR